MTEKILCIYHANCADGFTAAWAVWKRFPDAEFYPGVYGEPPPEVVGKHVVLVDFSYKSDVLDTISNSARSILILDHHKTAKDDILSQSHIGATAPVVMTEWTNLSWERHLQNVYQDTCEGIPTAVVYAVFDMERSGARIAWDFFHPEERVPQLVKHVEDRDLWRFQIGKTREIQACVFSYEYTFDNWEILARECEYEDGHRQMVAAGEAIERKHFKDIAELVEVSKRPMLIGGEWVWVANLPYTMASDACHSMAQMAMYPRGSGEVDGGPVKFGASYWDGPKGRTFSLRSIGDFDVSTVAKRYGGGGHKNAAGFLAPIGWEGDT